ncbi:MAG TPA: 3-hydroxyacyl-CoA dehydrogenase NAD-binding domain-containing protein [Thermoanaerobaculia bacterium]|nr:3-hydroxyacyl-CoA dehydrogenase NAD-binding domain-containing protein [Thermoanaerobaculia bacterium]
MKTIATVAVLGAGTMGRGIAHVAAQGGYATHLFDVSATALDKARQAIERNLEKGVKLGKVEQAAAAATLGRLQLHAEIAPAVAAADLVVEAVPERLELKVETFDVVARSCPPDALFASNTSGLSITEIAGSTDRADRFAGMHFFNPVHVMKLVELVRGLETSEATLAALGEVAARMGKEVVVIREAPGFVTSRINAMIGNEAFRMLETGVASAEDIDKALKLGLNHPMGPFEMVDLVGLDVRLSILQYLHQTLGETYRPSNLLAQYVKAGRLGRKTGKGVYVYDEEGNRIG